MNEIQKKAFAQASLDKKWEWILDELEQWLGKRPQDLDAVLFLIGVQELGQGMRVFTKEEKQDLMHIAVCRILSKFNTYILKGIDKDGFPIWELNIPLPFMSNKEQEELLKTQAMEYFFEENLM